MEWWATVLADPDAWGLMIQLATAVVVVAGRARRWLRATSPDAGGSEEGDHRAGTVLLVTTVEIPQRGTGADHG